MAPVEKEIVRLFEEGNVKAMDLLYDNYSDALYGVILRMVGDEAVAGDVLQEAFVKIWQNSKSYDPDKGRLFTWMLQISRNLAIDKLRSREYSQAKKTEDLQNHVYPTNDAGTTRQNEDDIGVKDLLDHLREEERLVIDLVYFQGYTQSEIAKEKNIPLGSVKTRLRMAMKNLRRILNET